MIEDTYIKNSEHIQIGSNIRRVRLDRHLKSSDLVREVNLLGVNLTLFSLSKIEANTQHIKASQLKAIMKVLGCSAEELLQENEKA